MVKAPTDCQEQFTHNILNIYPRLDNVLKFRLKEINRIKYYFFVEIFKRKTISKMLSKYIAALEYIWNKFYWFFPEQVVDFLYLHCSFYWCTCWNSKCKP